MIGYILDASVAAKWVLPSGESLTEEAVRLLHRFERSEVLLSVPDLFWPEIGNVFLKAVRRGVLTKDGARQAIARLGELGLPTFPSGPLLETAFAIAARYERSVYDATYVALAVRTESVLLTADERLATSLAAYLPVRWLGAIA